MIIKLYREENPEAPFATKSDLEAAFEEIAKHAGSEHWYDTKQVAEDVKEMRRTLLISRTLLLHEDLQTAIFLANKVSEDQFEFSPEFGQLVEQFNRGMVRILQGERDANKRNGDGPEAGEPDCQGCGGSCEE
jgi:hypothetical protein